MPHKHVQWTGHDDNEWRAVGTSTPQLKPGVYNLGVMGGNWILSSFTPKHDKIVRLGVADILFRAMQAFWDQRDTYKNLGFVHKCGYLLEGKPGTGKTLAAITACQELVAKGGAAFILPPRYSEYPELMVAALKAAREVNPEMPLAAIWEDIDAICNTEAPAVDRALMTNLLDGETQIDNVVHIATTNYYERLDKAFRDRPGRFSVIHVGPPSKEVRLAYLKAVVPNGNPKLIEELAAKSDGFILDHIKSMLVSVFIHGNSVDEVVNHLKQMTFNSESAKEPALSFSDVFAPIMQKIMSKGSA